MRGNGRLACVTVQLTKVEGGVLFHLAGPSGEGGDNGYYHTLVRVNIVRLNNNSRATRQCHSLYC